MKETSALLYEWRQQRLSLSENFTEKALQELLDWWNTLSPHTHGFNFDDTDSWPDVWQYITEGFYTKSGNGLGIFYTLAFAQPEKEIELWLVHDLLYTDMVLMAVVDNKYVLNRDSNRVEQLKNAQKDLNILKKYSKKEVLEAIKFNN